MYPGMLPRRRMKMVAILAMICVLTLGFPSRILLASGADHLSKDQTISSATQQSTMVSPTGKASTIGKTPVTATNASAPSAIFLREYHTPPKAAEEPTRRAKLTW